MNRSAHAIRAERKRPATNTRTPGVSTIVGFFALSVGVAAFVLGQSGPVDVRLWTGAFGSLAVGVGALVAVKPASGSHGWSILTRFGPASIVLYTFTFGVFGLAWLAPQSGGREIIDPERIPGAITTSMLGLIGLTAGYLVGPPRALIRSAQGLLAKAFPSGPWSLRVPSIAILLYLIGTAARTIRLSTGQYGYLQDGAQALASPSPLAQLLSMLESLTTIALVVAAIDWLILARSGRARLVLVVITALEVGIGLSSASKEQVLFTFVTIALVMTLSGKKFRLVKILPAVIFVSLLFPFMSDYRSTIRTDNSQIAPMTALAQVPTVVRRTLENASVRSILLDGPSEVASRLRLLDNVAIVQQKTPADIPFEPWSQLMTGPLIASIPRALWPSKPIISTGRQFAQDYYELPSTLFSANGVTFPGDLYRHGGMIPLLVGMMFLGLILRYFDRALSPAKDPRHLIVFVPVFLHLIKLESDVTVFLVGLAQLLLFAALTSWLVFTPSRRDISHHLPRPRQRLTRG